MRKKIQIGRGYAWKLEEGELCNWCEPTKSQLFAKSIPSLNAKMVRVHLIQEKDFRKYLWNRLG